MATPYIEFFESLSRLTESSERAEGEVDREDIEATNEAWLDVQIKFHATEYAYQRYLISKVEGHK